MRQTYFVLKYLYLYLTLAVMSLLSADVKGQNMVPNGSFEQYTVCPSGASQMSACAGWRMYHVGTSDYFNTCALTPFVGVPSNNFGYQNAASGNGYVGGATYNGSSFSYKEYVARNITPLTPGSVYEVSMSLNLANLSTYGTSDMGAWFYCLGPTTIVGSGYIPVTPQISYSSYGVISDTANWIRVVKSFIADSAYDNIVIGGFGSLTTTNETRLMPGSSGVAYYYIDSIVVKKANGINISFQDTALCIGDTMKVSFALDDPTKYLASNIFTLQLSDPSGSFATPTNLTTIAGNNAGMFKYVISPTLTPGSNYRIRVKSSNAVDSSGVNINALAIGVVIPNKPIAFNNGPICVGNTLLLNSSSTTGSVSYYWTGPHNYKSYSQNPVIISAASTVSGIYTVAAKLYGCISRDTTRAVVVDNIGGINNTKAICENDTLRLLGSATSTSYSWVGPASFSSSAKDTFIANATSSIAGNYIFTTILAQGCTVKDTISVIVKPKISSHSANSNNPICEGDTLKLSATSTTAIAFAWSGPASYFSVAQFASRYNITGAMAGAYIVSYSSGNGCYVYDTVQVTAKTSPVAITASANSPVCQSDTLKLTATNSSAGVSWAWVGPSGFSATTQNATIPNVQTIGNARYHVKATAANGCYRKDSVDVIIKAQPQNFSIGTNSPICQGGTLSMSGNTSSTAVGFSWAGPSGYSSALQSLSFTNAQPTTSGRYILTATLNGCVIKDTETVNVIAIPTTPVPTANTPVCMGQTLVLNAGSAGPGYVWTGPPGFNSSAQQPTITNANLSTSGTYTVRAIDGACTSPTASVTVSVLAAPMVNMYPSPKDSICQGAMLTLIASASDAGTGHSFKWYRNNSVIGGASGPNHSNTTTSDYDTYFCTVTSNGTCATPMTDTSNVITMRVFPWLVPSVSISATPNGTVNGGDLISFTSVPVNGGNLPKYQWMRNNKPESGATGNTWGAKTLNDKDVVCVTMTSSYLCPQPKTANSNCITVSVNTTGINEGKLMKGVGVYPNPVTNELVVEGIAKGTRIQLFDALGRMVVSVLSTREKEVVITSTLMKGNYVLQLINDSGERMTAKVVKE